MSITVALAWIPTAIQRNFMNWQMRIEVHGQDHLTEEDGKEQAEQVLEDLGIDGMGLVDSDRTVWFPNGACSERNGLGLGSDALWQGDLDRGLPGYLYCFRKV